MSMPIRHAIRLCPVPQPLQPTDHARGSPHSARIIIRPGHLPPDAVLRHCLHCRGLLPSQGWHRLAAIDALPEADPGLGYGADRCLAGGARCTVGRQADLRHHFRFPAAVRLSPPFLPAGGECRRGGCLPMVHPAADAGAAGVGPHAHVDCDGHRKHGVRRAVGGEWPEASCQCCVHQPAVAMVQRRGDDSIGARW